MRIAALAPALLLLLATACAPAPGLRQTWLAGWSVVDAGEVRLFGDIPPAELQRLADDLVLFDASFAHLVRGSPKGDPVRVFVIGERGLGRQLGLGDGVGGWMLPTLEGSLAVVEGHRAYVSTRILLFHEYTHALLRRHRKAPVPPWYDEGLASFFSTVMVRNGVVVIGAVPVGVLRQVASRGPLPLDALFEGEIRWRDPERVARFYATSWALSHYLLLSPAGRREMSQLVEQLSRGVPAERAQRVALRRPPGQLEAELREYVGYLAHGVPAEVILDEQMLDVRGSGRVTPLSRADAACELGILTLRLASQSRERSHRELAVRLLGIASSDGPPGARCAAAQAEALALHGQGEDAARALEGVLVGSASDATVLRYAGRVELARAEAGGGPAAARALASAETHFRRAVELDPQSASAWFGLGRSVERAGRTDEALAALGVARRLGWSPSLDLALGELELERGDTERALELLRPLARDPHGGPASEAASRLLDEAGIDPAPEPAE